MFGPLFDVQMSKKCTPMWREADFQVKSVKNRGVRATFWRSHVDHHHHHHNNNNNYYYYYCYYYCYYYYYSNYNYNYSYNSYNSYNNYNNYNNYSYTTTTTTTTAWPQLQLQLQLRYFTLHYTRLRYIHYPTLHYDCNYTTLVTLHHNYNPTALQLRLQLQYTTVHPAVVGEVTTAIIATTPTNTNPTTFRSISGFALPSVIHNQPTFPIGFLFWNFRHRLVRYYWYTIWMIRGIMVQIKTVALGVWVFKF